MVEIKGMYMWKVGEEWKRMQASPTPKVQRDKTGAAAFECGTTGCGEKYIKREKKQQVDL